MKRITVQWHAPRSSEALRRLLVQWRTFVLLSACTFIAFVAAGLAGMAFHSSSADWPAMSGAAASLSDGVLGEMTGMELPSFESSAQEQGLDGRRAASFLIRFLTGINPHQPRSLLASELPGMEGSRAVLLRPGSVGEHVTGPEDHPPLPAADDAEDEPARDPDASDPPGKPEDTAGPDDAAGGGTAQGGGREEPEPSVETKRKIALIYHSHNRESWLPELGEGAKIAESGEINITLVGKRLAQRLEEAGIGAVHADVDYATAIEDYRWELSYKYSKETVVEAMAEHDTLTYLFDIHRDSQPRGYTTATIDGKDYAQVYFIIGKGNPGWRENEAFAAKIHKLLEQRYPGISRGIWGKDASNGNGEYNQSLSPNSLLIEIGGIENTLEECYRTADALAEVIAELYRSAVETNAGA
jgi:stage II sporulation protein P